MQWSSHHLHVAWIWTKCTAGEWEEQLLSRVWRWPGPGNGTVLIILARCGSGVEWRVIRVCRLCPLGGGSTGGEGTYYHSHHICTLYSDCGKCKEHWTIRTITIRSVGIIQPIRYNKFSITNYISSCEFRSYIVDLENWAEMEDRKEWNNVWGSENSAQLFMFTSVVSDKISTSLLPEFQNSKRFFNTTS